MMMWIATPHVCSKVSGACLRRPSTFQLGGKSFTRTDLELEGSRGLVRLNTDAACPVEPYAFPYRISNTTLRHFAENAVFALAFG